NANTREIKADVWSVSQKIEMFRKRIQTQTRFRFSELFAQDRTRNEVVVTFLALLEMIRMKQLRALQSTPFEEIEICVAEAMDPDSAENGEEETAHQDPPLTPKGS
ncbi:MAG: segregation/condensation protein A, partial [Verrucomicrobiota bacterium]|nr:segregation/condensation protein A [Verrucomicrobiota bacterium]